MKHAYLSETEIERALNLGQISATEASQLQALLAHCAKRNKRYGNVIIHTIV